MKRTAVLFMRYLAAIVFITASSLVSADSLVIVATKDSTLTTLSRLQLRKLYLGIPVVDNGITIKPLRNESDPQLIGHFHRLIVGMSEPSYNRKLMRNRLNYAANPPLSYADRSALFDSLFDNKNAISYTWLSALNEDQRLKVLQVIWRQD